MSIEFDVDKWMNVRSKNKRFGLSREAFISWIIYRKSTVPGQVQKVMK